MDEMVRHVDGTDDVGPRDHQGLEVLDADECWERLRRAPVGRIGFTQDGQPTIIPVNHVLLGHRIVIRTARGALLHEALMNRPLAFEVDGFDPETRTGWSVLVQGLAEPAHDLDPDELGLLPWADAIDRDHVVVLWPEDVNGRQIVRVEADGRST
jgi:nitroimidazol reductase NimA-like FMN-containing flavoprotein (pyridoxamine 5'-phosphate oxidase superfamily)